MSSVLFLDFDGVLHADAVYCVGGPPYGHVGQPFEFAGRLADVLDEHPGVAIVFSTSWQYQESTEALSAYLPERLRVRVRGGTADDVAQEYLDSKKTGWMGTFSRTPGAVSFHDRQSLAEGWMQAYRPGVPWLSLDDDTFRFGYRCPRLLHCQGGFLEPEAALLQAWLVAPGRDMQEIVREHAPADPADWTVRDATAAVPYRDGVPVLDGLPEVLRVAVLRLMPELTTGYWQALLANWGRTRRGPLLMDKDEAGRECLP